MRGLLLAFLLLAGPVMAQPIGAKYGPGDCPFGASGCTVKPTGGTSSQTLGTLAADIADVRGFGAVCDGTNNGVTTAVNLAVSAGYTRVLLPKNCFYVPTANTTPANVQIVGENWQTSIISPADRTTSNVIMGAHSSFQNVGVIGFFCDTATSPASQHVCPTPWMQNVADTTITATNWAYEAVYTLGPSSTAPGAGSPSTDIPGIAIAQLSSGGDGMFIGTGYGGDLDASFTASIAATTMTVTAIGAGTVQVGRWVAGAGVASNTIIQSQLTGSPGSTGTYSVSVSQTVGSEAMRAFVNFKMAAGASGLRMVMEGDGDLGLYLINGQNAPSSYNHSAMFAKEYANTSTVSNPGVGTIKIDRVGDGTDVNQSLLIYDTDSAGSTNTRPAIQISLAHQSSGSLLNFFQATTPYSGSMISANMGNSGGTFTGNFAVFQVAGSNKYLVDSNGNTTASGYIQTQNGGLVAGAATGGSVPGSANVTGGYLKNNVGIILSGTTGSIGGGALAAGACTSGTVAVTNSTTAMSVAVSPVAQPQADATHGLSIWGFVSSAGTVTVEVCAIVATTPVATTYNVRVMQ